jgi:hypothetical protein
MAEVPVTRAKALKPEERQSAGRAQPDGELADSEVSPSSPGAASLDGVCFEIHERLRTLEYAVVRECLVIADLFVAAKVLYERETRTGHGRRNPEGIPSFAAMMGSRLGRSEGFVEKYLRIAKIGPDARALISEMPGAGRNLTLLLDVAREADLEKQAELLLQGGRPSAGREHLSDRNLVPVLKNVLNPRTELGRALPDDPLPKALTDEFPALERYRNVGELRSAAVSTPAGREERQRARRTSGGVVVPRLVVGVDEDVVVGGTTMKVRIREVRVPRDVLLRILEETKDDGVIVKDGVNAGMSPEIRSRHEHPPITVGEVLVSFYLQPGGR